MYEDDDAEEVTVAELQRVINNMHVVSIRNDKEEDTKYQVLDIMKRNMSTSIFLFIISNT